MRTTLKQAAKRGDTKSARICAGSIVRSNKQKDRLSVSKARLNSIGLQLQQQLGACLLAGAAIVKGSIADDSFYRQAMAKVTGSLQKSTEIMKLSNSLLKLPQLSATMRDMSMEMTKVCCEWVISVSFVRADTSIIGRNYGGDAG